VLLAYNPDRPHADYINEPCTYRLPQTLSRVDFRYVADTQRSWAVLEKVLAGNNGQAEGWGAEDVVAAVEKQKQGTDILPHELEVEINTERSVRIAGYPHGRSGRRGPMSMEQWRKIVEDCRGYDDVCLTVGGYGEPLAHGDLPALVAAAKAAGIYGINIETDGRRLTGELAAALAEGPADVISVYLDADSEEGYRQAKGEEGFAQVAANVGAFAERSWAKGGPLVAPHLVKTRGTMAEMEAFYDRWLRQCGAAVITGYNDFAGQIADQAVMNMAPPRRTACGRLGRCLTILADGRAVYCQQDFAGKFAIGNVLERSVGDIWRGGEMEKLREAHRQGKYGDGYLCGTCKEWHR
jgi:spiro-SPASM protein